ncbi:MAG TPA: ATP-binding protein [Bryobacteraceae bacterium]|nr:ATP-binding protein [Bryobacteraceae bacterium]
MHFERARLHYGSIVTGYLMSLAMPILAAFLRERLAATDFEFPFIHFYPVIWAVSFFWGAGPGAAAVLMSAFSVPLILPIAHPAALNWVALAAFGSLTVLVGSVLRALRESATEAAQAIVRFRLVTENITDWVLFLNAKGCVAYANKAACAGIGRTLKELAGHPLTEIVARDQREEFSQFIRQSLDVSMRPREWLLERSGGELIPVEVGCTAITAGEETVIHVGCRDLRERRETERKLREARQWEALGALAGGLAHDFNNLLTAMMGNASLAREMLPPSHECAGLLDSVLYAGARSATLIEMMLAAAGYRRSFAQNIDLDPLLASAIAKVKTPENVRILAAPCGARYFGEYSSLERLLVCLIENAVESYETAGGEVRLELGLARPGRFEPADFEEGECGRGECLRIAVEDRGSGMEPATLERAFDPFFTTKFMGRGLGLAAVRGLVRAYSGKLWMRSRPGAGTRIEIWLPKQEKS